LRSTYFGREIALNILGDAEGNTASDEMLLPGHPLNMFAKAAAPLVEGGTACATSRTFELLPPIWPTIWSGTACRLQVSFDGARSCRSATKEREAINDIDGRNDRGDHAISRQVAAGRNPE
jgi:hypothetical protein